MVLISTIALSTILFGMVTRFYWAKKRGATHDTWYHLHVSDEIRKEGRLPDRVDQFLISGPYDYPPGLHIIMAAFPHDFVVQFKWLFAPIIEAIHLLVLIVITFWLTQDITTALVAGSIYATYTTQIVQFTAFTPRVIGSLLVSVLVLLVFFRVQTGELPPLAVAVLVGIVVLHTHKMSSQTILFLFLFLSIIWVTPLYLGIVVVIVVLAVLISKGHYLTILRGHVNIINFWRRQHRAGRPPGEFMRRYGKMRDDDTGPVSTLERILAWVKRNEWTMFIADNTWAFLLAGILAWAQYTNSSLYTTPDTFVQQLAVWALFILGFGILTEYVPYFKLVGEGNKYFMWGAFPTAVVLAVILPVEGNTQVAVGYVVVLAGTTLYSFARIYLRVAVVDPSSRTITTDGSAVVEFMEQSDGNNVLLLPFGMSFHLLYESELNILFHQNPKIEGESAFPVPIEPLEKIVTDYGIDFVVMDTTMIDVNKFDTDSFENVFEDNGYLVLQLDKESKTA